MTPEDARKILSASVGWVGDVDSTAAHLDGHFTIQELEAAIVLMRADESESEWQVTFKKGAIFFDADATTKAKALAREAAKPFGVTFRDEDVQYLGDGSIERPFENLNEWYEGRTAYFREGAYATDRERLGKPEVQK